MDDDRRMTQMEVAVAALRADLRGHEKLCDGRWRVMWKLAAALSGIIALVVSVAVAMMRL